MADATARLGVMLADMLELLQKGLIEEHSVTTLNEMKEKKQFGDYLALAEKFGECMAFLPHDEYTELLSKGWTTYLDVLNHDRKNLKKKLTALREDKKTEPDILAKYEGNMEDLCVRRATAVACSVRFKAMTMIPFESFQKDPALDAVKMYDDKMKA